MKRAVIYYFTGTGNTRRAAEAIAAALSARGFEVNLYDVRAPFSGVPDPNDFELTLFGYPVYAYNTPAFFLRFVRQLPDVRRKPAYLFKTSGEPFRANNASSWQLVRLLRKKGFVTRSEHHLLMPYNILFRYHDALVKQMDRHTKRMAAVIAACAADGGGSPLRFSPLNALITLPLRIQRVGGRLNGRLIHAKKTLCNGCGLCVRVCPSRNIRLVDARPHFGGRCTMCMACAYYCPHDAVRPGLLSPLRVNGPYPFAQLAGDDSVPDTYVDKTTKGYFRLFLPYYERTNTEIRAAEKAAGKKTR